MKASQVLLDQKKYLTEFRIDWLPAGMRSSMTAAIKQQDVDKIIDLLINHILPVTVNPDEFPVAAFSDRLPFGQTDPRIQHVMGFLTILFNTNHPFQALMITRIKRRRDEYYFHGELNQAAPLPIFDKKMLEKTKDWDKLVKNHPDDIRGDMLRTFISSDHTPLRLQVLSIMRSCNQLIAKDPKSSLTTLQLPPMTKPHYGGNINNYQKEYEANVPMVTRSVDSTKLRPDLLLTLGPANLGIQKDYSNVLYFTDKEVRTRYRVYVMKGLLGIPTVIHGDQGNDECAGIGFIPCDHEDEGGDMVVMNLRGELYSTPKERCQTHHSSLANGLPVIFAGFWKVRFGVIQNMVLSSGHYQPTDESLSKFYAVLMLLYKLDYLFQIPVYEITFNMRCIPIPENRKQEIIVQSMQIMEQLRRTEV